ncbi:uncharacterized protein LOC132034613 [Lycium ferocissimum]|uniref:uncharacterized protein LOC132034613 n=1 Tax=Lycium ferocissimum TaxID=112874 RepID=UPI002815AB07|nr:uncharacterized protein LOC132034613 [Lycium ferocissimum]
MPCLVTFVPKESVPDRLIDGFKGELAGVTAITRVDDVVAGGGGHVVVGVGGDVAVGGADAVGGVVQPVDVVGGGGGGLGDDVPASIAGEKLRDDDANISGFTPVAGLSDFFGFGGNFSGGGLSGRRFADVGAGTSKVPSCACECTTCKDKMDNLIRKVEELVQAQEATNTSIQRLISKRGANQLPRQLASVRSRRSVATPDKSIETRLLDVGPKVLKKVDIFKPVHAQRKKKVETAIRSKKSGRTMYSMHEFGAADFKAMTSMEIWWEDWYVDEVLLLMRMRQINFPEYYDSTDIILDLNFYNNMSKRYAELTKESTVPNVVPLKVRLAEFKWDDDMVDYCRGVRPYPGGCSWAGAKRVLTVMNINVTHFVTLEFMIEEGVVNVYDCNVPVYEESDFFCFMER